MGAYDADFYARQQAGSLQSARRVLPHLLELVAPRSIVDVGCGVGTWLKAAAELGVRDLAGLDGAYVDSSLLQIPLEQFTAVDLTQPFRVERTFDVALSLEVAEHLPEASATSFVESLTRLAPVVLFSAAIPRQMGAHHVNEQWQTWWVERFARAGFTAVDCMRPRVWDDPAIEWWYAQNMFLMIRDDHFKASPALQRERENAAAPFAVVHPRAYLERLAIAEQSRPRGLAEWLSMGPPIAATTLRRWLGRADKV
jgi:SAM-dependent methyltransferase